MQANVLKRSAVAVAIAGAFALGGVAADRVLPSAAFAAAVPTVNPAAPTVAVNGGARGGAARLQRTRRAIRAGSRQHQRDLG